MLHGGPGSGCPPAMRTLFDPNAYRIVLFDQRNCGRSTPHASRPETDLSANTTHHLVSDIERLREELGIERWLVLGWSWGSTLGLAYAEAHPDGVSELVLAAVTTGRHAEFEWTFRGGLARFYPQEWDDLCAALPPGERDGDVVAAYNRLLGDGDEGVRRRAARAWCTWESAIVDLPPRQGLSERYEDPDFAVAFARLVTHYVRHDAWLEDGALLEGAGALAGIPGVLVTGRADLQAPFENAWRLARAWPDAELVAVPHAAHSAGDLTPDVVAATDRFRERS